MKIITYFSKKVWIALILVCLAFFVGICIRYVFPSLKEDNIVEEFCEKVIKKQADVDIDLTPASKE